MLALVHAVIQHICMFTLLRWHSLITQVIYPNQIFSKIKYLVTLARVLRRVNPVEVNLLTTIGIDPRRNYVQSSEMAVKLDKTSL